MAATIYEIIKSSVNAGATGHDVIARILCDTVADLPVVDYFQNITLIQGCTAHVIEDNTEYMLQTNGTWSIQAVPPVGDTYTKAEIDEMLSEKQDILTFDTTPTAGSLNPVTSGGIKTDQDRQDALEAADRAALIKLVNSGSKNKLKNSAATQTVGEVVYTVYSDGTVSAYTTATTTVSRTLTITSTDDNCYVNTGDLITGNPDTTLDIAIQYGIGSSGNIANYIPSEEYHVIAVSGYVRYCLISIRSGVSIPQSSPLIFRPMICTAEDYAISTAYVPYRPSWQEMYEMIQQLQSGRSVLYD